MLIARISNHQNQDLGFSRPTQVGHSHCIDQNKASEIFEIVRWYVLHSIHRISNGNVRKHFLSHCHCSFMILAMFSCPPIPLSDQSRELQKGFSSAMFHETQGVYKYIHDHSSINLLIYLLIYLFSVHPSGIQFCSGLPK